MLWAGSKRVLLRSKIHTESTIQQLCPLFRAIHSVGSSKLIDNFFNTHINEHKK
ncbi:hypothetical protein DB29_01143 [Shouchella clausii]|nr:hypothetical protein DB29_01143 [Shouchella clausii]